MGLSFGLFWACFVGFWGPLGPSLGASWVPLGAFMGAFVNLPSIYIAKFYPKGIATARACTMNFFFGGMMCGAMIASSVYETQGKEVAWACVGACPLLGALILSGVAAPTIKAALDGLGDENKAGFLEPTKERLELLHATQGMDPDLFLKQLKEEMLVRLQERNYFLWHGTMQKLIDKCIDDALPELRPWDDHEIGPHGEEKAGFSFLQDVASLHVAHGSYDMVRVLEGKFKYDLHSHFDATESFFNHHVHVDWGEYTHFIEGGGSKQAADEIFHRNRVAAQTHH